MSVSVRSCVRVYARAYKHVYMCVCIRVCLFVVCVSVRVFLSIYVSHMTVNMISFFTDFSPALKTFFGSDVDAGEGTAAGDASASVV